MNTTVSVIMPAYRAETTILPAVESVIAQTHDDWRLLIVSDDGRDYRDLLARSGVVDERLQFLSSPHPGSGASKARNLALDRVTTNYVAVLDADDRFKPAKLERAVAGLAQAPIVSTALEVMSSDFSPLRLVGAGEDRLVPAVRHKWLNFSMDTMIVWDRRECDARYDPQIPNMTDLEFLMQLYRTSAHAFHIGAPLHDYVKLSVSMSNGPGVTERMISAKSLLLERLAGGYYPMADPQAREGIEAFLRVSLEAEKTYQVALATRPGLLFEDHLEPLLSAHAGP